MSRLSISASNGDILGHVSFGNWLRQERTRQKLGVNELARRAILSPATITRLESGELKAPSQATVQKLSKALHVRYEAIDAVVRGVDWVFVEPGMGDLAPEVREIALEIEKMTPAQFRLVKAMIRTIKEEAP